MIEQGTDAWLEQKAGKFSGSRFNDLLQVSKTTGKPLKARDDLIWDIVTERLTGQYKDQFSSAATDWGKEQEENAIAEYELEFGFEVERSGFIQHPEYSFVGGSPDGLIGNKGGIEVKCPKSSKIHLNRFIHDMESAFMAQVQGYMWITGRKWWDWISYDPRMPESHKMYVKRIKRDEAYIDALKSAVLQAEKEVNDILISLKEK